MKRLVSTCVILLAVALLVCDASAQVVKLKRVAMSPGLRSSGEPNYTAPVGPYTVSTGLRVVGKLSKVYFTVDTTGSGATAVTTVAWTITGPGGSTAVMDSTGSNFKNSFSPDMVGTYYITATGNGTIAASDTILASTYTGVTATFPGCALGCHAANVTAWQATPHATIFARGITGMLEVEGGSGAYAKACIKCHTTGWEPTMNNGNFGYLVAQTGWDTTWYKTYPLAGGDYWIPSGDSTQWKALTAGQQVVGNIGCESCHGPGADHQSTKTKIGKSLDAGVCNQCHDAPKKHRLGSYWNASAHATMHKGHASSNSCYPCHSGSAFVKFLNNKTSPGYSVAADGTFPVSCSVCHDPHGNSNPNQLRTVSFDSLANGFVAPAGDGGKGQLCMNCHHSRYVATKRVTTNAPYYGFVDHYGPHGSNQADMFFGRNAYQFGDNTITGQQSHGHLANACVTCHMQTRTNGSSVHSNHQMNMNDGTNDMTGVCATCHGPITTFDDIKASYDYDGNGTIEGVQTEIEGLMAKLKARLPIDVTTGEPTLAIKDTLLVKGHPEYVQGIYTYAFVKNDGSMGIHNPKYAVAILQKALGTYPLDVKQNGGEKPTDYALNQNYPNPFNPSTKIQFALPEKQSVKLEVFDILGNHVKTLVNQDMGAGKYELVWNGVDQNGARVASGMYLYKLQAGNFTSVKKMLLVK